MNQLKIEIKLPQALLKKAVSVQKNETAFTFPLYTRIPCYYT